MEKKSWAKLLVLLVVVLGIGVGMIFRWRSIGDSSDPLAAWGLGKPGLGERSYYTGRMNRLIEKWGETRSTAAMERDGQFKDSYRTVLVIDPDEQAIWIEEGGVVKENSRVELPGGTKWAVHHITPEGDKELTGRVVLKMRGAGTSRQKPERFHLISDEQGSGHYDFQFEAYGGRGGYQWGTFNPQPVRSRSKDGSKEPYGSLLVTAEEYEKYRAVDGSPTAQVSTEIEENEANWLKAEKALYGQIERQVQDWGYELRTLEIEPGPDFSAGHAEIRGRDQSILGGFRGPSSIDGYLKIDYLGEGIWYVASAPHPYHPTIRRRMPELEFLVGQGSEVGGSQRKSLLAKGREIQQAARGIESKWKVTLAGGGTVELLGICENPSAGKKWWGPDGSELDYVPYINTKPYGRGREDRKLYEFAYRIKPGSNGGSMRHGLDGCVGSYSRQIQDRYGFRIIEGLSGDGYSFDASRRKTDWNVSLGAGEWKTALTVKDKVGEIKFLDKQRIVLNPPEIEDGEIVVRCFEEFANRIRDCRSDFAAIIWEDGERKTVSLDRWSEDVTDHYDTGLCEHKFVIDEVSMSQIESICLRYHPYESVTFKNISLRAGEDQGFEIQVGQAAGESNSRREN